jgi:DNA-binding CsgD family transcriptional regulator
MGHSRVVTISGPLASGKTALLHSFARDAAAAGASLLEATASRFERHHPLGIMDQILRGRQFSSPITERKILSLFESACADQPGAPSQVSLSVLNLLHSAFQDLAGSQPLVVCVDDAHFMDIESLQYLLALTRRMSNAPVSFIFSHCLEMGKNSVQRIFQSEIPRMPNSCYMPLKPLSVTGVAAVLGQYLDLETADRLAAECLRLSGGKPLLVHALAEDAAASRTREPGTVALIAGPAFGRAVLNCLYRSEPVVLGLSQAIAILGACASSSVVARFCDVAHESVRQIVAAPGLGGLLDRDFLGQPSVRTSVISSIPPDIRHAMHSRAARLLHDEGTPALIMAEHLMLSEEEIPWADKVLREAADQALISGDRETAISYLRKAHHDCADKQGKAAISARLADVIWHHNPCAAKRYLPDLVAAIKDGCLTVQQSVHVIMNLLWNGEIAQAASVLALLDEDVRPHVADNGISYFDQLRLWLPLTYPGIASKMGHGDVVSVPLNTMAPAWGHEQRAVAALGAALKGTAEVDAVSMAEVVLREAQAGVESPASSFAALAALIYSDRLDKASAWCDSPLPRAGEKHGPVWEAMFLSARAAVSYRLGDLANAERRAQRALTLMSPESWGTALVVPLAFLVLATTAMGRYKDAESYLKFPVPDAAFETLGGLHYLNARGHFNLAAGRYDAALQDFLTCGHLMRLWDVDCPAMVPWRTGAAQAYLCKGLLPEARELIAAQLARLSPGESRTRAMTYRVHAATLDPRERRAALLRAAGIFERCGDSLGLAYTLTDLSHACEALGDPGQAQAIAPRARALAGRCNAAPLQGSLAAVGEHAPGAQILGEHDQCAPHLSKAELRVAELAAKGSTNEQIARKLFITVSTVEQHLTHVYRKLAIQRRTELSSRLREPAGLPAAQGAARIPVPGPTRHSRGTSGRGDSCLRLLGGASATGSWSSRPGWSC